MTGDTTGASRLGAPVVFCSLPVVRSSKGSALRAHRGLDVLRAYVANLLTSRDHETDEEIRSDLELETRRQLVAGIHSVAAVHARTRKWRDYRGVHRAERCVAHVASLPRAGPSSRRDRRAGARARDALSVAFEFGRLAKSGQIVFRRGLHARQRLSARGRRRVNMTRPCASNVRAGTRFARRTRRLQTGRGGDEKTLNRSDGGGFRRPGRRGCVRLESAPACGCGIRDARAATGACRGDSIVARR